MTDAPPPKKIYDCFIFYNELDLLEIRLNELYDVVDYFVICEATVTFKGRPKSLVFADNRERFAAFADKIIHLIVDDMPMEGDAWDREFHQRSAIRRALIGLAPVDIVMISDVDEFCRASTIEYLRNNDGYFQLKVDMYQFYMNMLAGDWGFPFAYSWSLDSDLGDYTQARVGDFRTLERFIGKNHKIEKAGWHFTFLGGADRVRNKLSAYSHDEQWQRGMLVPDAAERQLSLLMDVGGGQLLRFRPIDATFPRFVQDNLSSLIASGLVKDSATRLRELENELFHFIGLKKQGDLRAAYNDVELARAREAGFGLNLALDKPAMVSSVAHWLPNRNLEEQARNANDGTIPAPGEFAFHTEYEENPWWQVDLGSEYIVDEVVIYNRQEYADRLRHFSLLKSSNGENWQVCFQKTDDWVFDAEPCVVRFSLGEQLRFLRIRLDGHGYLHFAQCLVYGREAPAVLHTPTETLAMVDDNEESTERAELDIGEAIRLVVWDLDETFWKGTVSEGGLKQYVQANHDIVIALAKRGIMSSICSKNDEERICKILYATGILDYFVFPSISWDAKGPRLQALIEDVQLRPASVMFIDDNPSNRAEAAAMVPGLQIEDETFIPRMLEDPRFAGKDDGSLSRLAQYKLLETRKTDETQAGGDNEAFLRASNITVKIDFDIEAHIDRVIELVNRTNQLNFTKARLPENPEEAKSVLRDLLKRINVQAGVVSVRDRYGDHGVVGFYLLIVNTGALEQFCFSCRVLGMGVELWLYDLLKCPAIAIEGPVAIDLFAPHRQVDWISHADTSATAEERPTTGRIILRGACDLQAVAHYFAVDAAEIVGEHDFMRDGRQVIVNHTAFNNAALLGLSLEQLEAAEAIGLRREDFVSQLVDEAESFDAIVLSFWADALTAVYRHKTTGLVLPFQLYGADNGQDFTTLPAEIAAQYIPTPAVAEALEVLRRDYDYIGWTLEPEEGADVALFEQTLDRLFARIPAKTPIFIVLACDEVVGQDTEQEFIYHLKLLNDVTRNVAARWSNVILINPKNSFVGTDDIIDYTHFDRMVYYRIYKSILAKWSKWKSILLSRGSDWEHRLPSRAPAPKTDPPPSPPD